MLKPPTRLAVIIIVLSIFTGGCGANGTKEMTATVPQFSALMPYLTLTPTTLPPSPTPLTVIPVTPAPTPTPFVHTVVQGETMLGIAIRYGITLADLQAANPSVDPQFMSIGTILVIPLENQMPALLATPTPFPLTWQAPVCYLTGDGGLWCLALATNDQAVTLENLSAWIGLYDLQGNVLSGQVADAPLNILRPGESLPLMAYFSPPIPDEYTVRGELLTAIPLPPEDPRYLQATVQLEMVTIAGDGRQAWISGQVALPEGSPPPSLVWILAVAYSSEGHVAGVRKWESPGNLVFEGTVYSLGAAIERIEVLVEARP